MKALGKVETAEALAKALKKPVLFLSFNLDADIAELDVESAHGSEDVLYMTVLQAIADGNTTGEVAEIAREAMKAADIGYPRYCA